MAIHKIKDLTTLGSRKEAILITECFKVVGDTRGNQQQQKHYDNNIVVTKDDRKVTCKRCKSKMKTTKEEKNVNK